MGAEAFSFGGYFLCSQCVPMKFPKGSSNVSMFSPKMLLPIAPYLHPIGFGQSLTFIYINYEGGAQLFKKISDGFIKLAPSKPEKKTMGVFGTHLVSYGY